MAYIEQQSLPTPANDQVPLLVPLRRGPRKLGDQLLEDGMIDRNVLRLALERKVRSPARLGRVLRNHGLVSDRAYAEAVARQWRTGFADLATAPPDPDLLINVDARACLRIGCIPWRRFNGKTLVAIADPDKAKEALACLNLRGDAAAVVVASEREITGWLDRMFRSELEADARETGPPDLSCRAWQARRLAQFGMFAAVALGMASILNPGATLLGVLAIALLANLVTASFRLTLLAARFWPDGSAKPLAGGEAAIDLTARRDLPVVSLLVPLHREDKVLPHLITNLAALDYPVERLDIKLLIEERDRVTAEALAKLALPAHFDVIAVPDHGLKTKPRAMNFGLNYCRGEIVGILDAEDRPDPGQIDAVARLLLTAPSDVACAQGRLDFYNPRHNWLSRCFTIEYAIWFNLLLRGMLRLGLPIPLGGTTVYFRRSILEKLCAWDAYNVTEDADLGMRLARYGYRTAFLNSTTHEEANAALIPWIRQRSRWLKGYLMTWAVHMRQPRRLRQELGLKGFLAFQIVFLGGAASYLSIPLFWLLWLGVLGLDLSLLGLAPDHWIMRAAIPSLFFGQAVMVVIAALACLERGKRGLLPWTLSLLAYWPLGALAACKAIVELFTAPFFWDKTQHGGYAAEHATRKPETVR